MKKILENILKIISWLILIRYRPKIIGVTGSVGKTSVKEAIYCVLKKKYRVRKNFANLNNEIGVPLTIIGEKKSGGRNLLIWLKILIKGLLSIIYYPKYPKILVLEMGVDKPGDMRYLLSFLKIEAGVFTAIGEFPVHLEFFPEKGKLIEEKALLLKSLPKHGLAVLNYDDLSVRMVGDEIEKKVKVGHYGFGDGADMQIANYEARMDNFENGDYGASFKLYANGSVVPVWLNNVMGRQYAYAAAAAAHIGIYYGMNMIEISEALADYRALDGRAKLVPGIKKSILIDDSYNSSPMAVAAGLELMEDIVSHLKGRTIAPIRIAVLGDMLELGVKTEEAHRTIGQKVGEQSDLFFAVGERMVFAVDEARKVMGENKVFHFYQAEKAGLELQKQMKENSVILIKGSRSMGMEKIVEEVQFRKA